MYFHQQFKSPDIKISSSKIETPYYNDYQYIFLSDKIIPRQGIFNYFIKIVQLTTIWIGICIFNLIPKQYYKSGDWGAGHGFYAMRNDGATYSHHDQSKNSYYYGFSFSAGDVIKTEVNNYTNKITWSNLKKNQSCELDFIPNQELFLLCFAKNQCY